MTSYFFLHLLHWRECSKNQASSTLILVRGPLKREHIQPDFRDNNPTIQHLRLLIDFLVLLTFFRLIGLLPKCNISSRRYFSCHLLSDIPSCIQQYLFISASAFYLIFNGIFI